MSEKRYQEYHRKQDTVQDESLHGLIRATLQDLGYVCLESLLMRSKNKYTLRVVIYHREHSVSANDCTEAAEILSRRLDIDDPIEKRYDLIVESPGLEREMKSPSEYPYFIGKEFKVFPLAPHDFCGGEGFFIARLESCTEGGCTFASKGGGVTLAFDEIRKARLYYDFQQAFRAARKAAEQEE